MPLADQTSFFAAPRAPFKPKPSLFGGTPQPVKLASNHGIVKQESDAMSNQVASTPDAHPVVPANEQNNFSKPGTASEPTWKFPAADVANITGNISPMTLLSHVFALEEMLMKRNIEVESLKADLVACADSMVQSTVTSTDDEKSTKHDISNVKLPAAVNRMAPYKAAKLEHQPLAAADITPIPASALQKLFNGTKWSDGVWVSASDNAFLRGSAYYLLDSATEPYLPSEPGKHCAKLTLFFRDFEDPEKMLNKVPLFVSRKVEPGMEPSYHYLGHYSQTRWSDKLGFDEMSELSNEVKQHWARICTDPERPAWLTEQLKESIDVRPKYEGAIGEDLDSVKGDICEFLGELVLWQKAAEDRIAHLTSSAIMEAFERPDADLYPGLRLWYEYLECVSFERNWYYTLATAAKKE